MTNIDEEGAHGNSTGEAIDVLIVGAGPVGLFLANECARRDVTFRLIESRPSQSQFSKALAIMPRTLELFDMAGIVEPFLRAGNRVTQLAIVEPARVIARMKFQPDETPYPFVAMVPQNVTEDLLVRELARKGGRVEYDTTCISVTDEVDYVRASIECRGVRLDVKARFLVGCDGAHSAVRHFLNLPFDGEMYADSFLLADTDTNNALPSDELQLCPSEFGPLAIFPISATRRRIVATIDKPEGNTPSLDTVRKIVAQRGPRDLELLGLHWSSYFRVHHRQVSRLRSGRVFLAGDSAQVHSPIGGQGMNTGLHDVWNLVWKLDLAARGIGTDRLLESYNEERRPVIRQVIEFTDFLTKALATPSRAAQTVRDALIPVVTHVPQFQHRLVQRLSQLGIAYQSSPMVEGSGNRYYDSSLGGGTMTSSRFVLFVSTGTSRATMDEAHSLSELFANAIELRSAPEARTILLRPDGYIAYETSGEFAKRDIEIMRSILERQLVHVDMPS